jgi:hypothetical protein
MTWRRTASRCSPTTSARHPSWSCAQMPASVAANAIQWRQPSSPFAFSSMSSGDPTGIPRCRQSGSHGATCGASRVRWPEAVRHPPMSAEMTANLSSSTLGVSHARTAVVAVIPHVQVVATDRLAATSCLHGPAGSSGTSASSRTRWDFSLGPNGPLMTRPHHRRATRSRRRGDRQRDGAARNDGPSSRLVAPAQKGAVVERTALPLPRGAGIPPCSAGSRRCACRPRAGNRQRGSRIRCSDPLSAHTHGTTVSSTTDGRTCSGVPWVWRSTARH